MFKRPPTESLANQIVGVLTAVPAQFDPEDDNIDGTKAKLSEFEEINEEGSDNDETLLSTFRKQNIDLLADVDARYAGEKGSRKSFQEDSSGSELDIEGGSESKTHFFQENESFSEEEQSGLEDEESVTLSEENSSNFQRMSEKRVSQQVKNGLCIRNQMSIWENLLEMRIQMQKCLVAANKLPQKEYYKEMIKDIECKKTITQTTDTLSLVLNKFLTLQDIVIKKYPETKKLEKIGTNMQLKNDSDQEISSDTDKEEIEEDIEIQPPNSKRRTLNDYEKDISELHGKYKSYRNDTIEKWNTKTRLSITKNSGQIHSVVNQIEYVLTDRDKLRKRTQLKRSEYRILSQNDSGDSALESNEDNVDVKQGEDFNTEIFDDNDFYHQLLRELIEVKSADITDPVKLGRQWIQLQNLRSKMKRKIDTRATKGRKIRYAVHTKLVNFMASRDKQSWTEEAKDEFYSSLFGKIQHKEI